MSIRAFLLFALLVSGVRAQPVTYSTVGTDEGRIEFGTYPLAWTTSFAAQVTVDPTALTIRYDEVRFSLPSISFSRTQTFTVGFGETDDYVINVELAATELIVRHATEHVLAAGDGGTFVAQDHYAYHPNTTDTSGEGLFSGTFSVVGPNGETTGAFTSSISQVVYSGMPAILDTNQFPGELTFDSNFSFIFGMTDNLFTQSIDGRTIDLGFDQLNLDGRIGMAGARLIFTEGELTAVPEPATTSLAIGALIAGYVVITRRRHQPNRRL